MAEEELLSGGNLGPVVRVGDTVRRVTGPWTPSIHALLRHLEGVGFAYAPRVLGIDDEGREVLTFIEGATVGARRPWPAWAWSDATLVQSVRILRDFHQAVRGFEADDTSVWRSTNDSGQHGIICHNDFAPYNIVRAAGRVVGVIDWDMAGPGSPEWDLAMFVWSFAPLSAPDDAKELRAPVDAIGRRLRLLCDAYGLDDRSRFIDLVKRRMESSIRGIQASADAGESEFQALILGGHLARMKRDALYAEFHGPEWQRAIER